MFRLLSGAGDGWRRRCRKEEKYTYKELPGSADLLVPLQLVRRRQPVRPAIVAPLVRVISRIRPHEGSLEGKHVEAAAGRDDGAPSDLHRPAKQVRVLGRDQAGSMLGSRGSE